MDEIITHDTGDRRRRICRCAKCGIEQLCTPSFDFYAHRKNPAIQDGGPLECERCFRNDLTTRGIRTDALPPFEN